MKKFLLLFTILCFSSLIFAISGLHQAPVLTKAGISPTLEIQFTNLETIDKVTLHYRYQNDTVYESYEEVIGRKINDLSLDLPLRTDENKIIEYYIVVDAESGRTSFPANNPNLNPYMIQIPKSKNYDVSKEVFFLSPQDKRLENDEPIVFVVSYFAVENEIDKDRLMFHVNGKKMKPTLVTANIATLKLDKLPNGNLDVYFSAFLKNGKSLRSESKRIQIKDPKIVDISKYLSGSATFNSFYTSEDNDGDDEKDKKATLALRMSGSSSFVDYSTKLFFSSRESSKKQSINKYTFTIGIPHFETKVGDYSPNYGDLIVKSTNIRGIHNALEFKYFRLYTTFGEKNRAIDGVYSSTQGIVEAGEFARSTMAFRTEVGSQNGFQWGLTLSKSKDDIDSIDEKYFIIPSESITKEDIEEETLFQVTPKDNIVVGTDLLLALFNRRFELGVDVASSLYNSNIYGGVMTEEELDDLGVDIGYDPQDFEDLFVINTNLEPYEPGLNSSAFQVYSRMLLGRQFVRMGFSQVGSSYNSLTSGYVENDTRSIFGSTQFNLMQNKLMMTLNGRMTFDNLADQKESTTESMNISTSLLYSINSDITVQAMLSSFQIEDDNNTAKLIDQNTMTYQVSYKQKIHSLPFAQTTVQITYLNQNLADDGYSYSSNSEDMTARESEVSQQNMSFSLKNEFNDYPATTTISYTRAATEITDPNVSENSFVQAGDTTLNTITLGSEFKYFDNKVKPYVKYKFSSYDEDNSPTSNYFILGTKWQALKDTQISTSIDFNTYSSDDIDNSEFTGKLKIVQRF